VSIRSAVFAIALAATPCAQAADSLLQALTQHPLGVIITIGRWLTNSGERVYEVEVEGRGDTLDLARDNGHRLAVQQAVGSLNLRQTQRDGDRVTQDRQIIYSSGFIQDWRETRSYRNSAGQWCLVMTVRVRHSSIADGLVDPPRGDPASFDGARVSRLVDSRDRERTDGTRLLSAVLEKFPGAVQITHAAPETRMGTDGLVRLVIRDIQLVLNPHWVKSLGETLDRVATVTANPWSLNDSAGYAGGWVTRVGWSSWSGQKYWYVRHQQQQDLLLGTFNPWPRLWLRIRLLTDRRPLHEQCVQEVSFHYHDQFHFVKALPQLRTPVDPVALRLDRSELERVNGVVFDLVPQNLCR